MSRHTALMTILRAIDMTAEGISTPADQIHRSLGTVSPQRRPFINVVWGGSTAAFGATGSETVQVWAYDETSYVPIEKILDKVRDALLDSPDELGDVQWNGYSDDLYDDIFKCATRYAAFTLPIGSI